MQKGTYKVGKTPDAFQRSMIENPPEWEMKGRAQFGIDMPSGQKASTTPMTSAIPEKGQANRAALDRDLQRAKAALDTNKPMNFEKPGTQAKAEVKPNVPEAQVKPGDVSTKGGKVVSKGSQVSSKVGKLMKGGAKVAGSIGAALGGEMAVEKGLEALGVENEHIKGVVAPTVGWAAGEGALATALGLARGVGMGAALAAGGAAAVPAAVYGALAYPSYKAAEASQAAMEKEAERIKKAGSATRARFIGPKY